MATITSNCTLNVEKEFWYDEAKADWDQAEGSSEYSNIINQCNTRANELGAESSSIERGYAAGEFNQNLSPGGNSNRPNQQNVSGGTDCCGDAFDYFSAGLVSTNKLDERIVNEYYTPKEEIGLNAQLTYVFYCIILLVQDGISIWRRETLSFNKTVPIKRYKRIEVWEEDWSTEWDCSQSECCSSSSSSSESSSSSQDSSSSQNNNSSSSQNNNSSSSQNNNSSSTSSTIGALTDNDDETWEAIEKLLTSALV